MSAIITGVLDLTFGLLWEKFRDHTAERLRDGDVTDERCRQVVVRELANMKAMLEGLSRKDLLASISFLKEGVCLLNMAFENATDDVLLQDIEMVECGNNSCREAPGTIATQILPEHGRFEEGINTIKPLSQMIASLGKASTERLTSAKKSFRDARREATIAFNNEALTTADRILACKLRVISRILENVEDPTAVVETSLLYLKELHNLEAIKGTFNVHINGGLKSLFNKQKRQELISSVIMISYVLASFTLNFARTKYDLLTWPKIDIRHASVHPLLDEDAANAIMQNANVGAPNALAFERLQISPTTKLEFIPELKTTGSGNITEVITRDGVIHFSLFPSTEEITWAKILLFVTHDGLDNIFIVAYTKDSAGKLDFCLLVAKETGIITCESNLQFLSDAESKYRESWPSDLGQEISTNSPFHVEFAVNKAGEILIFGQQAHIYVSDSKGVLTLSFDTTERNDLLCVTDSDNVISAAFLSDTVRVYSLEGNVIHQFNLARGQVICDVVSHHFSRMLYTLTRNFQTAKFQLEIYTDHGEHRGNLELVALKFLALVALREGPVAAIHDKGFILT